MPPWLRHLPFSIAFALQGSPVLRACAPHLKEIDLLSEVNQNNGVRSDFKCGCMSFWFVMAGEG
jgi:hypothetical protein